MTETHFADRLFAAADGKKSHVVAGLDPRIDLIPSGIVEKAVRNHGKTPEAVGEAFIEFNDAVIDAVADLAVAVKCQIAFYERYGIAGLEAYKRTIRLAEERGLIVIGDVKRNDIGSTADAYARAHLRGAPEEEGGEESADFRVDAVTVNPLFGADGISPFVRRAAAAGAGVFALVRTSNPTSADLQELRCGDRPFYHHIAALVNEWAAPFIGECGYSMLGAVVGATFPRQLQHLRSVMPAVPLLIPGFGAQGGGVEDAAAGFDPQGGGAVVSSSRGLIYAYRNDPYAGRYGESAFKDAVRAATEEMRAALWKGVHGGD